MTSLSETSPFLFVLLVAVMSLAAGSFLKIFLFQSLERIIQKKTSVMLSSLVKHLNKPSSYAIPLLTLSIGLDLFGVNHPFYDPIKQMIQIALMLSLAWVIIKCEDIVEDVILAKFDMSKQDNIKERTIHTQMNYVRKMVIVVVVIFTGSLILMSFDSVRKIGSGLLASAGVAGILIGMAAQNSLKSLLAGFQIAFTQPIRYDDVVIVEGEWGRIEEITLTYVVVRIWDMRRLVLPLNYFIEKPFQNWTRTSADILGTVYIYTDYTIPINDVREELMRILENHPAWDKKVGGLQITNSNEQTVELRALMSAVDSGKAWDLRCHVREQLISYIQKNHPQCLAKIRIDQSK